MYKYLMINFHRLPLDYPDTDRGMRKQSLDKSILTYVAGLTVAPGRTCIKADDLIKCVHKLELQSEHTVANEFNHLVREKVIRSAEPTKLLTMTDLFRLDKDLPYHIQDSYTLRNYQKDFKAVKFDMLIEKRIGQRQERVLRHEISCHELIHSIYWELVMLRGRVILDVRTQDIL